MTEQRFLLVRLGSMGDIIHTLPAEHALRTSFPESRISWVVESKWAPLLEGNPDLNDVIPLNRGTWAGIASCIKRIRATRPTCAVDFQGLYKSAVLARFSGARQRVGYSKEMAREGGAAMFYTQTVTSRAQHIVDQHLEMVRSLGAVTGEAKFTFTLPDAANTFVEKELTRSGVKEFYVISPGGGWKSKCWPAERYGHLHRKLAEKYGWRAVVSFGPGERALAQSVLMVAGEPEPILVQMDLPQLMAALRRAKFFVGGDTGPLHLAAALGTPVVGIYGPTDPNRNGPYGGRDEVVRMAHAGETTYKRGEEFSAAMMRVQVEDVCAAIEKRLGIHS
ncbi:MAG: glycosyltransferase family 9 protein [Acidobacteria bacterium]|nr:glycosyltransferase family 9 protein [Acidobacteriota bacterium]